VILATLKHRGTFVLADRLCTAHLSPFKEKIVSNNPPDGSRVEGVLIGTVVGKTSADYRTGLKLSNHFCKIHTNVNYSRLARWTQSKSVWFQLSRKPIQITSLLIT